jgi:hypothetical protein
MKNPTLTSVIGFCATGLFIACALVVFPSCSQGSGWINTVDWKELDLHNLPGAVEYPDAGAIVLLDEGTMEVFGTGEVRLSVFERHRIVRVLTPAGQRYANVVISYSTGMDVESIQARTISPDGIITPVKDDDIFDVSLYPNYIFFSDQRARLFTLPAVENGSVLEYRYRLRISGHTLWHSWSFQDRVPTLLSRFTLLSPAEYPVKPKLYGISITPKGVKMPAGFKQSTVWEARNIPPLRSEFGMPAEREVEARLAIAPLGFRTWDDVAKWYGELANPRASAGPRIKALVARITAGAADDHTKLQRIYEWVQMQVRYMAVEIGVGGYQPHAAEEVCTKLYGDCKDMTTLLCSMAHQAGIEVRQALVSTWQNGIPDTSLASPLQFNHAIAFTASVDGGLWMDATEKSCRFGELPWFDQGLPVLLVENNGKGRIVTTPRTSPAYNCAVDEWDVRLDSTGGALVRGESWFKGSPAIEQRHDISDIDPTDRQRWMESYLARRCPGAMLDSMQIDGLKPVGDTLLMRYLFHTSMFAVRRVPGLVVHPGWVSASGLSEYFRSPSRGLPVRFQCGTTTELALTVHLPVDWGVVTPESADSLQSPFGSAHWSCRAQGSVLTWSSGHSFVGNDIVPAQYGQFQQFLDAMQEKDMREIEVGYVGRAWDKTNTEK